MSGSDRSQRTEALTVTAFCALAVLGTVVLLYTLGLLNGRESERRQQAPAAYSQAAQADAQRACAGRQGATLFECVYERVEASQEQARGEQDLSAQQRAASAALASAVVALLTLVVSAVGVWLIKQTLDATLRAVEDTTEATNEMRKANAISNRIAEAELRPYLFVESLKFVNYKEHTAEVEVDGATKEIPKFIHGKIAIHFHNYGKIPARNIRVHTRSFLARLYRGEIEKPAISNVTTPVCAPGYERRIFEYFFISDKNIEEFKDGGVEFIIRLRFTYDDGTGNSFSEKADYRMSGSDLDTFYLLLSPFNIFAVRKRWREYEPELYGDDEHQADAAEG